MRRKPGLLPLLVTGYVPEPDGLLAALGAAGLYLAGDDYAPVGRRISRPARPIAADPWAALLDRYWGRPPCPTSGSDQPLMRYLEGLFKRSGLSGVGASWSVTSRGRWRPASRRSPSCCASAA